MADTTDSKSVEGNFVRVQVPPSAPIETLLDFQVAFFIASFIKKQYNSYMENYRTLIEYVNSTTWQDNTDVDIIISQAQKVFTDLTKDKTQKKMLYRLCGQTGSGKTTQLLSSVENFIESQNLSPVVLGVRTCAEYHPDYENFKQNFPAGELREKTNGFALKCMSYVLKLLIENGFMILLDITLLDPVFEKFVLDLLIINEYNVEYHILAVNRAISDQFIAKRFNSTGRVIYKSSADYFYKILPIGLKYICDNDNINNCYVWNAFNLEPVFFVKVENCFEKFIESQNEIKEFIHTEEELKNAKLEALKKHL